jgi:hypothetical protein
MVHDELRRSLFDKAREMTGEFVGDGTVELVEKPHVFLVMFHHGSRNSNVAEYAVITMDTEGNLHSTDIMTDDSSWVSRIIDDVSDLVLSLSTTRPNPLNVYSINKLQAEIDRRAVNPWEQPHGL